MKIEDLILRAKGRDLYLPIVINEKVAYSRERIYKDLIEKKYSLFPDFNNESIVEFGCNNGLNLVYMKKYKNAGVCLGLDNSKTTLEIANFINNVEDLEFKLFDMIEDSFDSINQFDNSFFLSICSPLDDKSKSFSIDFDTVLNNIIEKTKKNVYIEPTNHLMWTKDKLRDHYDNYFKKFGEPTLLGYTDYQNRALYRLKT